jgi:hypothetical protein
MLAAASKEVAAAPCISVFAISIGTDVYSYWF